MSILKPYNIKNLFPKMLFSLSIYFFTATIIHPWYICTLIAISVFTKFRFSYLWSVLSVLSYATYNNTAYEENLWLTSIEYILVYSYLFYELYKLDLLQKFYSYFRNIKLISKKRAS